MAEAVIPLPSSTAVVAADPDIPPHIPAPQPVPYELSSSPTFIWYVPTVELPPLPLPASLALAVTSLPLVSFAVIV